MAISRELNMGRAGEYLVLADLLLKGYQCFDSGQGANYDLIMENENGKLIKIQVKTTEKKKQWNESTNKKNGSYFFYTKRCGKNGIKQYKEGDFDLYDSNNFMEQLDTPIVSALFVIDKNNKII